MKVAALSLCPLLLLLGAWGSLHPNPSVGFAHAAPTTLQPLSYVCEDGASSFGTTAFDFEVNNAASVVIVNCTFGGALTLRGSAKGQAPTMASSWSIVNATFKNTLALQGFALAPSPASTPLAFSPPALVDANSSLNASSQSIKLLLLNCHFEEPVTISDADVRDGTVLAVVNSTFSRGLTLLRMNVSNSSHIALHSSEFSNGVNLGLVMVHISAVSFRDEAVFDMTANTIRYYDSNIGVQFDGGVVLQGGSVHQFTENVFDNVAIAWGGLTAGIYYAQGQVQSLDAASGLFLVRNNFTLARATALQADAIPVLEITADGSTQLHHVDYYWQVEIPRGFCDSFRPTISAAAATRGPSLVELQPFSGAIITIANPWNCSFTIQNHPYEVSLIIANMALRNASHMTLSNVTLHDLQLQSIDVVGRGSSVVLSNVTVGGGLTMTDVTIRDGGCVLMADVRTRDVRAQFIDMALYGGSSLAYVRCAFNVGVAWTTATIADGSSLIFIDSDVLSFVNPHYNTAAMTGVSFANESIFVIMRCHLTSFPDGWGMLWDEWTLANGSRHVYLNNTWFGTAFGAWGGIAGNLGYKNTGACDGSSGIVFRDNDCRSNGAPAVDLRFVNVEDLDTTTSPGAAYWWNYAVSSCGRGGGTGVVSSSGVSGGPLHITRGSVNGEPVWLHHLPRFDAPGSVVTIAMNLNRSGNIDIPQEADPHRCLFAIVDYPSPLEVDITGALADNVGLLISQSQLTTLSLSDFTVTNNATVLIQSVVATGAVTFANIALTAMGTLDIRNVTMMVMVTGFATVSLANVAVRNASFLRLSHVVSPTTFSVIVVNVAVDGHAGFAMGHVTFPPDTDHNGRSQLTVTAIAVSNASFFAVVGCAFVSLPTAWGILVLSTVTIANSSAHIIANNAFTGVPRLGWGGTSGGVRYQCTPTSLCTTDATSGLRWENNTLNLTNGLGALDAADIQLLVLDISGGPHDNYVAMTNAAAGAAAATDALDEAAQRFASAAIGVVAWDLPPPAPLSISSRQSGSDGSNSLSLAWIESPTFEWNFMQCGNTTSDSTTTTSTTTARRVTEAPSTSPPMSSLASPPASTVALASPSSTTVGTPATLSPLSTAVRTTPAGTLLGETSTTSTSSTTSSRESQYAASSTTVTQPLPVTPQPSSLLPTTAIASASGAVLLASLLGANGHGSLTNVPQAARTGKFRETCANHVVNDALESAAAPDSSLFVAVFAWQGSRAGGALLSTLGALVVSMALNGLASVCATRGRLGAAQRVRRGLAPVHCAVLVYYGPSVVALGGAVLQTGGGSFDATIVAVAGLAVTAFVSAAAAGLLAVAPQ